MFSRLPGGHLFESVKSALLLASALGAGAQLASIALLATSGWLISAASLMPPVLTLSIAVVAVRTFGISRSVLRYFERLISHNAAFTALADVRTSLYENLARVAPAGLLNYRHGDLVARAVADVDRLADYPLRVYLPIATGVLAASVTSLAGILLLPFAGLILAACLFAAIAVATSLALYSARTRSQLTAELNGEYTSSFTAATNGITDLIALNQQEQVTTELQQINANLRAAQMQTVHSSALVNSVVLVFQGIALVASLWIGADAVSAGTIDGRLLAVLLFLPLVSFESVLAIPNAFVLAKNLSESLNRIDELINQPNLVFEPNQPQAVQSGLIELAEAKFTWSDGRGVQKVNLEVRPETIVGLTGPSGVGKTSLANGLVRFLPVADGSYSKNGTQVDLLQSDELRAAVKYFEANQHIFTTTIAANLLIAKPEATEEELTAVLHQVALGEWLAALEDGLETVIGERGYALSGGQRQRLLLARLLLAKPEYLVLDEPTEYLDDLTATKVLHELKAQSAAILLISHRERDLAIAQQIISLTSVNTAD